MATTLAIVALVVAVLAFLSARRARWMAWRRFGPPAGPPFLGSRRLAARLALSPDQERLLREEVRALRDEARELRDGFAPLGEALAGLLEAGAPPADRIDAALASGEDRLRVLRTRFAERLSRFAASLDDRQRRSLAELLRRPALAGARRHGWGC
jgi:uncharacterized membrane protein